MNENQKKTLDDYRENYDKVFRTKEIFEETESERSAKQEIESLKEWFSARQERSAKQEIESLKEWFSARQDWQHLTNERRSAYKIVVRIIGDELAENWTA